MKRLRTLLAPWGIVVLLGLAATVPADAGAAGVRIDHSFGRGGIAGPELGPTYGQSAFTSIEPQPDGTILAGRTNSAETLERFHRFGPAGQTNVGPVPESRQPKLEAVQPDGEILRPAGTESLERVDAGGTQDPSFGPLPYGSGHSSDKVGFRIEAIVVGSDGRIVVAGTKYHNISGGAPPEPEYVPEQLCIARLDSSGRLDSTFGKGGVVQLHSELGFTGERLVGIAARPGGGVVVIAGEALKPGLPPVDSAPGSYLLGLSAAGSADPGYGEGGTVHLAASLTDFQSMPDGSLLVAGDQWGDQPVARYVHESDFFLARFGDDGRPDPSFAGGAGTTTADFGGLDLLGAMLVEGDGSILLGGSSTPLTSNCIYFSGFCSETPVLIRFTAAGGPDPGFGTGGRVELSALGQPFVGIEGRGVESLAARPGGGVLAGGGSGPLAFLADLTAGGSLDPGFGAAGIAGESESHASRAGAGSIAIAADGRILVGGGTDAGLSNGTPEGAVFRLLPNGAPDKGFGGGNGIGRVPREVSKIAASGNSVFVLSRIEATISRLDASGKLDPSFGVEGVAKPELDARLQVLAALRGGGVLVGGTTYGGNARAEIVRMSRSGARDRAFGADGIARLTFGHKHRCGADAIAAQPDGRILVAGYVQTVAHHRTEEQLAVMRLLPSGRIDRSFGGHGLATRPLGTESVVSAIAVAPSGEIVVVGRTRAKAGTAEFIGRLSPSGRFDPTFGKRGVAIAPVPADPRGGEPKQVIVVAHRYLVVRSGPRRPIVAYRPNGRREAQFAKGTIAPNGRDFGTPAVALQHGKLLVARSTRKQGTFQVQRLLLTASR
jgi:uncharacterized delta-60 repeat protein